MEYAMIGIAIVAAIAIGAMIFLRVKKNAYDEMSVNIEKLEQELDNKIIPVDNGLQELVIQMEMLPAESAPDANRLVEITDSKVLAHVNNLVPGLAQISNAANNVAQAVQTNGEVFYRAIIPVGAKLTDSKAIEGAVRGIYHGADGIRGHANLVAVEAQKGTAVVANTAAAAMGVASMVVGQYYMNQINSELGEISDGILKISDFQDNEYRSRVFSLVAHVKKISDFQVEILENNELRISKISHLNSLEEECTQLLGQANLAITGYTKKTELDYVTYEKELPEVQNWYMYQKSLLDVLYKISELRYTLHLGTISREHCVALLPTYTNQVAETQSRLTGWHQAITQRLKIDASEMRRKREGVAIGIDMSQIPYHDLLCVNHNGGSKFMIDEVVYYDDNTEFMCKLMNTALINLRRGDSVDKVIFSTIGLLKNISIYNKNSSYAHEKEIRIVYRPNYEDLLCNLNGKPVEKDDGMDIEFYVRNSSIKSYFRYLILKKAILKSVISYR